MIFDEFYVSDDILTNAGSRVNHDRLNPDQFHYSRPRKVIIILKTVERRPCIITLIGITRGQAGNEFPRVPVKLLTSDHSKLPDFSVAFYFFRSVKQMTLNENRNQSSIVLKLY